MKYEDMSNEELYRLFIATHPDKAKDICGVTEDNRNTVIAFLKIYEKGPRKK